MNAQARKTISKPSKAEQQAILARLDRFSRLTDSTFTVPFTRFRIGAEAIIGLIPIIGDVAGLFMSSYVLYEAQRAGASRWIKLRILANMGIDFIGGLVPLIGDVFDAFFKANTRNTRLLRNHLEKET